MEKFTIKLCNEELSFAIENYKIIYGNYFKRKNKLLRNIEQILLKKDNSDFYKSNIKHEILINDENINSTNTFYYRIDPYFDLETDLKLGTKSLILKYLETRFEDIEYNTNFIQANKELHMLNNDYFNDNNITHGLMKIGFTVESLSLKNIFKLIDGELLYNGLGANRYDLDYNDLIILQLLIIKEISNRINKEIILTFNGDVDDELIDFLEKNIVGSRIKLLIFSGSFHEVKNINNYYLVNNYNIDLSSDIDIDNEIIMELPYHVDGEEINLILKNYISGKYNKKIIELIEIL